MTAMAPVGDSRRRSEAMEQARRREANESIEDSMQRTGRHAANSFFCECCDPRCDRTVNATIQEYESVREWPTHFLVAANHENPEVECVISETERYAIVETLTGEASKVALRTDPRSLYIPERN
jgi:hypothetical protein